MKHKFKDGDIVRKHVKLTLGAGKEAQGFIGNDHNAIGIVEYSDMGFTIRLVSNHAEWAFDGPHGGKWHQSQLTVIGNIKENK